MASRVQPETINGQVVFNSDFSETSLMKKLTLFSSENKKVSKKFSLMFLFFNFKEMR